MDENNPAPGETPFRRSAVRRWLAATGISLLVAVLAYGLIIAYWHARARSRIDAFVREQPTIAGLSYSDLHIDPLGGDLRLSGIRLTLTGCRDSIRIDAASAEISGPDWDGRVTVRGRLTGVDLVPGDALPPAVNRGLKALNYNRFRLDAVLDCRLDPAGRRLDVEAACIEGPTAGRFCFSGALERIDPSTLLRIGSPGPALLGQLAVAAVVRLNIDFLDDSLIRRLLHAAARRSGLSDKAFLQAVLSGIEEEEAKARGKRYPEVLAAVQRFLIRPTAVSLALQPEHPVTVGRLLWTPGLESTVDLLKVTVEPGDSAPAGVGKPPAADSGRTTIPPSIRDGAGFRSG